MKFAFPALALLVVCVGCGGTYVGDPKSFQRAFGQRPPKEAKIVHSYFWLSPHFTHEHLYFFEITNGSNVLQMLTNGLPLAPHAATNDWKRPQFSDMPKWFMPKDPSAYYAWTWKTKELGREKFLLLRGQERRSAVHLRRATLKKDS